VGRGLCEGRVRDSPIRGVGNRRGRDSEFRDSRTISSPKSSLALGLCEICRLSKCLRSSEYTLIPDMKGKILIADDDPEILAALSAALNSEGYDVITATNGREACRYFAERQVDLAILDLKMPVRDGWTAFERLTTTNPLVPIIIITARPDQYPLAVAAGVAAFMEKPLDLPLLMRAMDELLIEPVEQRLSRLAGRRPIARYLSTD
jgi:CheY-like chemotaxis protein